MPTYPLILTDVDTEPAVVSQRCLTDASLHSCLLAEKSCIACSACERSLQARKADCSATSQPPKEDAQARPGGDQRQREASWLADEFESRPWQMTLLRMPDCRCTRPSRGRRSDGPGATQPLPETSHVASGLLPAYVVCTARNSDDSVA